MNFQNLEYFIAISEEGNITRAAERLHVSQQALSNHISRLEEELGCKLFDRHPSFELTYAGKCFLRSATHILDIQRQTLSAINDVSSNIRGELKLGISHTRGQAILPLLLPRFNRIYPEVELTIVEGSTKILEEDLDKGSIDVLIGFMPFMLENAEARELMREKLYLVAPKSLLDAGFCESYRKHPDIQQLKSMPFVLLRRGDRIRTLFDSELRRCGIEPKVALETENVQTAVALAAEGMGLTVCPELYLNSPYTACGLEDSYIRSRVEVLPFFEGDATDIIAIGYNRDRYLSRIARDFIDMSLDTFSRFETSHPQAPEDPYL